MMRNDEQPTPTLAEVIGHNIRRIREADGWSQDRLAARLREGGFEMTRSSVAALECSGRNFDLGEFRPALYGSRQAAGGAARWRWSSACHRFGGGRA